jgi:hypothetical protein
VRATRIREQHLGDTRRVELAQRSFDDLRRHRLVQCGIERFA